MYRVFFCWLMLATPALASIMDSRVFINELHYDNAGADKGEFVEVIAPLTSDLSSISLTLYNGSTGAAYSGPFALDTLARGDTSNGYAVFTLDVSLQNGAPDGLALAQAGQVLQFLSYEGVFAATNGVAQGLTSTELGVVEDSSTPLGYSLQLAGQGDSYFDFSWQPPATGTPGSVNHGQVLGVGSAVPEPGSSVIWLIAIPGVFCGRWLRQLTRRRLA